MDIEEKIFKKSTVNFDKLIPYGFKKQGEKYIFSKAILDDSFRVDIVIDKNCNVTGKIIELSFNEEYNNFRIESITGEFVQKIRDEYENILIDIKNNCFTENYFLKDQTNRIANLIIEKYKDKPEFLWDNLPEYGVFRNPNNDKWYALIMNIPKNKIDKGDEIVEIINLKLDEDEVTKLLSKKGFYEAYHMKKGNWITIILDDTLSDEIIMKYITKSYDNINTPNEWIIPANPKYYDIINCFNDTDTIIWKQSTNIKTNDVVYMYVAEPYSAILYKCQVIDVDIPYEYKDKNVSMQKVMKIKLLNRYDKNKYTFSKLNEYGIKGVRGPRSLPSKLSKDINSETVKL